MNGASDSASELSFDDNPSVDLHETASETATMASPGDIKDILLKESGIHIGFSMYPKKYIVGGRHFDSYIPQTLDRTALDFSARFSLWTNLMRFAEIAAATRAISTHLQVV